ncbi:16S rRNA (guanine(966)-N(2))-methyltransferase RsmD [Pistricoccus aurantiacus]|uniref:Ribosomal RNA small subunit methyltransferase D n=1 Tax=Pistricoccus aurantiacus TaxID=1883414 RepID=A0A5B8SNV3_9GAMM|nr:16S rRNA (guanine(966)-N(2))-methyltransferase RsmD [Pistricoccus aurantiacus]QEA38749.1 16S rRNA (guanine(966)-N(2))-methyltransferase RsmD [Pistricoccus aurantiacus]
MKSHRSRHAGSRRASGKPRQPGRLRIIGGAYRRRLLPVLDHPGLRPTPDRVRETLYNWLTDALYGARVLDLYAGTGALGLEALSRGAREAWFVEREPRVALALRDNLATLGAKGQVITADAARFLGNRESPDKLPLFDLVLLDPPFHQGLAADACRTLEDRSWLAQDAWIYVETERELDLCVPATWRLHREVSAGDSRGLLFHRQVAASS